jgi:galactokinase
MLHLFVPGRVCLFGEHSDWAGGYRNSNSSIKKGYTIIAGTNQGIYANVSRHPTRLQITSSHATESIFMNPEVLKTYANSGKFFSYIAGVAFCIRNKYQVGGLIIDNYKTDLPIKKGLSSSAAICVLTARAFNQIYNLGLSIDQEMEFAYLGELFTGSKCGRMDQGCAYGNRLVFMTFDGNSVNVNPIKPKKSLHYVIVDLGATKNTKNILQKLNLCFPISLNPIQAGVQNLLGPINKSITSKAKTYIEIGDSVSLGKLMTYAQQKFDLHATPACPEELTSPVLHLVLSDPFLLKNTLGAKGVGSQGDGSAQFLVKNKACQKLLISYLDKSLHMKSFPLTINAFVNKSQE